MNKTELNKDQIHFILSLIRNRVGEITRPSDILSIQDKCCLLIIKEFTDNILSKVSKMIIQQSQTAKIQVTPVLVLALEWLFDTIDILDLDPFQYSTIKLLNIWN